MTNRKKGRGRGRISEKTEKKKGEKSQKFPKSSPKLPKTVQD